MIIEKWIHVKDLDFWLFNDKPQITAAVIKSRREKIEPKPTSVVTQMPSRMGQEFLSSLSFLKVFLIATIFYQLNVGGYKNMCKAAPIGESSKEVKYNMNPTRDFIHVGRNDAESKEEADKTRKTK